MALYKRIIARRLVESDGTNLDELVFRGQASSLPFQESTRGTIRLLATIWRLQSSHDG